MKKANAYKYDQLNRIAQSNSFTNFDVANNKWMFGGAIANMYKTSYTYDANGNIKNLQRCNAAGVKFDDMTYRYDEQNGNLISNKLYHVNDAIASGIHTADIDDEGTYNTTNVTTANNYTYDAIGNLTKDVSEQIQNIEWSVSGKIKKIIRTGISTKADLEYVYDAMGNRIAKILKPDGSSLENGGTDNPNLWTYTYYVRDAQGNIMANYQKSTTNSITSFKLIERSIYGSSRLGIDKTSIDLTASTTPPTILNHNLGLKNYELSNHLGNVTTVISDRKIPRSVLGTNINFYMPDIVSATDYYPFGMTMQERTFSVGGEAYRFGFNGKENDNESSVDGGDLDFGARIYDSRLGRWKSVDPMTKNYPFKSPYMFASNNSINRIDMGGCDDFHFYSYIKANIAPDGNMIVLEKVDYVVIEKNNEPNHYFTHHCESISGIGRSGQPTVSNRKIYSNEDETAECLLNHWEVIKSHYPATVYSTGNAFEYSNEKNGIAEAQKVINSYKDKAKEKQEQIKTADFFITVTAVADGYVLLQGLGKLGLAGMKQLVAAKGVGKALNGVDDVLANPNLLQGKSLEQVQSVLGNSKNWVNDVMRKSTRADGWVLREMNQAGTDFTGRMIQYHPGTPRHFGGAPYWKVSSGNGTFRIPLNP